MSVKTDDEVCRNFASNVRYLIARSGKQQQEVAADLGLSVTAFNNYLVGRNLPKFTVMQTIADYFHVNLEDLVRPLVGNSIMFSMQLTGEELDLVNAFRAASPAERSRAMTILQGPTLSVVPEREELMKLIAQSQEDNEELIKSIAENIERINAKRIRPLTPAQQLKLALETVRAGKKEGSE